MSNLYEIKDDEIVIKLDANCYQLADIQNVQYQLSDVCSMLVANSENYFQIFISSYQGKQDEMVKLFYYKLADQQIRSNLLKENGKIRDLIVEQAFKPLEDLENRIDETE